MYEYANRLAKKGYSIHIYYPIKTKYIIYRLPYPARWLQSKLESLKPYNWFHFDPSITSSSVNSISEKSIRDADIIIATWWSTALDVGQLSEKKGKKINLIQGFENWRGHEDLLYKSYALTNVTNVVIASFLKSIVDKYARKESVIIENAIDHSSFCIKNPIAQRNPLSVCMNYSTEEIKGSGYGIGALKIVKQQIPNLVAELFSIFPRPTDLPEWISFKQTPSDLPSVYNNNSIFISNSLTEGFGLVSVEAMACGCALICTDIPGHVEFAYDKETALLVEPQNSQQMAEKIIHLIQNNDERIDLANKGHKYVAKYSWGIAVGKLEQVIKDLLI